MVFAYYCISYVPVLKACIQAMWRQHLLEYPNDFKTFKSILTRC